jgi:HNH endonuclease/NUMOD4 motif
MTQSTIGASQIAPLLLEWWKPVVGFEGFYEVSITGKVRRVGNVFPLVGAINRKGYHIVLLQRPGKRWTATAHGIVATHFVGERPAGLVVNHKNTTKTWNWASNLEYITSLENTQHAIAMGTYKPGSYHRKLSDVDVIEIRRLLATGMYTTEIAKRFKIHNSAISRIQNGKKSADIGVVAPAIPNRGERNQNALVTETDVIAIRGLKGKRKLREIAEIYGISTTNVSDIQRRKIWKHVA